MKILLLGDFSSFHKYLKDGLVQIGHDVTIAATGDGFKKISYDYSLKSDLPGIFGKLFSYFRQLKLVLKSENYDIVQMIQPVVFFRTLCFNKFLMKIIFKRCKNVFLVGAGASSENLYSANFYKDYYKYKELYKIFKAEKSSKKGLLYCETPEGQNYFYWLHKRISGYIPIMYEYAEPYRLANYPKLCPTIPIPINLDEIKYQKNIIKEKIVIFHGLNRPNQKGTPIIKEAFERLQKDYPNEVETIIEGKMPLKNYIELMKRTNIVIDQTYSVSSGVNGLISMAMGKVTLGGGEQECLKEFGINSCPMIPIKPDADDIYNKLVELIKNKDKFEKIGEESRKYVEEIHDCKKIAQKYIEIWNQYE